MKAVARAAARARLRALGPEERARAAREIARRVWSVSEVAEARVLLLYASLPAEVDTAPVAAEARRRGLTLVYPRCLPETRRMALHRVGEEAVLRVGSYGILEPGEECPLVGIADIDAALIPGLAWDRAGGRLGRGAGYYDRLLADPAWRAFRCGLFYAAQEAPQVPSDPWDVPLEAVVTEREMVRVNR